MKNGNFMLGYDFGLWVDEGIKIPVVAALGHLCVVGSTGSGKSTACLYWLYKTKKMGCCLYLADFKASGEFVGISEHYEEFEGCYDIINEFYNIFCSTPEGGNGSIKILLIDEIAGLLNHYGMTKENKAKADEIRQKMSAILMLGRSRNCYLWLSMQRYSASIFPVSSGAADNFNICVGLGRLTIDGRRGLFAGEQLANEEKLLFGQGKGILLVDGKNLKALIIPKVSKAKLQDLLCRF